VKKKKKKLTPKQKIFIHSYLSNGFNATQAAISAGYSENTAVNIGNENLTKPNIKEYVDKEIDRILDEKKELTLKVIEEFKTIGFSDIKDFVKFDKDGVKLHDSKKVDGRSICEVSEGKNGMKIKLHDKVRSLEGLSKYLGIFNEDINIKLDGPIKVKLTDGS